MAYPNNINISSVSLLQRHVRVASSVCVSHDKYDPSHGDVRRRATLISIGLIRRV